MEATVERWERLWKRTGLRGDPRPVFREIEHRYAEPHRRYHTLDHVSACLSEIDAIPGLVLSETTTVVEWGVWLHDFIYEVRQPLNTENELRSAWFAHSVLEEAGADENLVGRVGDVIRATKHEEFKTSDEADLLRDLDLVILAESKSTFDRYCAAIREEYRHVPDAVYIRERIKILTRFLDRQWIFATEVFRKQYEDSARNNLAEEIDRLRMEAVLVA